MANKQALRELQTRLADRLQKLGTSRDKVISKSARKALHVLRTRGVTAGEAHHEFRLAASETEEPLSMENANCPLSLIDGRPTVTPPE